MSVYGLQRDDTVKHTRKHYWASANGFKETHSVCPCNSSRTDLLSQSGVGLCVRTQVNCITEGRHYVWYIYHYTTPPCHGVPVYTIRQLTVIVHQFYLGELRRIHSGLFHLDNSVLQCSTARSYRQSTCLIQSF